MLFLFFCPASVYQQSFLGGEQTAATAADSSAEQYRNQQRKPIRLATFEFDFKKQRGERQDDAKMRADWTNNVDRRDSIETQEKSNERHGDEIDYANGNCSEKESIFLSSDCLRDINSLSRSMHDLINNLNDNRVPRRRLKSRSTNSSLNSIPENLNSCNYHSSSPIHCDEIEKTATTPRNRQRDLKNGNSLNKSICETPKSANGQNNKYNRKNLYDTNRSGGRFDSDDFRNSNATVSTSSGSLTGDCSTGNDIETSDSFVNIQFAGWLAREQKSSSTQSMESTDSFENVSFQYTNQNNCRADRSSQIPLKLAGSKDQNKSVAKMLQSRITALNVSRLSRLDDHSDKNCGNQKIQETNKCTKNEPVKLRHERYINKKMDSRNVRSKRYSCFAPCVTNKSPEEICGNKVTTRKFNSTDELRDEVRQKPVARTKRFSLYYTPQPSRKTYESETKAGRVVCKSTARVQRSEISKGREEAERVEKIDKNRRSVIDASTVASRSKSNRQNIHVRPPSAVVNANRIK